MLTKQNSFLFNRLKGLALCVMAAASLNAQQIVIGDGGIVIGTGTNPPGANRQYKILLDDDSNNNSLTFKAGTVIVAMTPNTVLFAPDHSKSGLDVGDVVVGPNWQTVATDGNSFRESYLMIEDGVLSDRVSFTPIIPRNSLSKVLVSFRNVSNDVDTILVEVVHVAGSTIIEMNPAEINSSEFVDIGSFTFTEGSQNRIDIIANGAIGKATIDAIKIEELQNLSGGELPYLTLSIQYEPTVVESKQLLHLDLGYSGFTPQSNYRIMVNGVVYTTESNGAPYTHISDFNQSGTHRVHTSVTAPYELSSATAFFQVVVAGDLSDLTDDDGDLIQDSWEFLYTDELDSFDAGSDDDDDGLTNAQEYALLLNPVAADTDGDGFADKWEIDMGYSPSVNEYALGAFGDSDGDRLANRAEDLIGVSKTTVTTEADLLTTSTKSGGDVSIMLIGRGGFTINESSGVSALAE